MAPRWSSGHHNSQLPCPKESLYAGINMTTLLPGSSFSQHAPVNSVKHKAAAVALGRVSNLAAEALHHDWEGQVQSLRQLICELLVKNQQLRWALMEMKEHELRDKEGPSRHKSSKQPLEESVTRSEGRCFLKSTAELNKQENGERHV